MFRQQIGTLRKIAETLFPTRRNARISGREELVDFIHAHAAHVAQSALYGYLKTRMGTQFRTIFQDDTFVPSIARARDRVFLDCMADLTIFTIAHISAAAKENGRVCEAAIALFAETSNHAGAALDPGLREAALSDFAARVRATDWEAASHGTAAFVQSPAGLVDAAPVIVEFRDSDREIIENSVKFRWIEVCRKFHRNGDHGKLAVALFGDAPPSAPG